MKVLRLVEMEGVDLSRIPEELIGPLLSIRGFRVSDGRLIPRNVAGFVGVGEWKVLVLPRIESSDFMRMLFHLGMVSRLENSGFEGVEIFREMALYYLRRLREVLYVHGPPRFYSPRTQESIFVRGKIERVYPHRVRQKVWEMKPGPWTPLLLRAARRCADAVGGEGYYLLRDIESLVGEIDAGQYVDASIPLPDEPYRGLVLLAKSILEDGGIAPGYGQRLSFYFLVDTARLFESYVLHLLERGFDVQYQRQFKTGPVTIRPDFIVNGSPADAKYRFAIDNGDIYQAISYAVILGSSKVFLLYPYLDFQINISCCKIMGVGVLVHDVIEKLKKEVRDA